MRRPRKQTSRSRVRDPILLLVASSLFAVGLLITVVFTLRTTA